MNPKCLRLLTAVFLSAIMLMGCNNVGDPDPNVSVTDIEEPIEDPKDAIDPDNIDTNNVIVDTEEPIEDPKDAHDPDIIDENIDDEDDLVPDLEDPIEDPKDVNDPDNIDE